MQCDQIGRFIGLWTTFHSPLATISLPKSPTFLGNFYKDVKILNFYIKIIFGQLLLTFWRLFLVTLAQSVVPTYLWKTLKINIHSRLVHLLWQFFGLKSLMLSAIVKMKSVWKPFVEGCQWHFSWGYVGGGGGGGLVVTLHAFYFDYLSSNPTEVHLQVFSMKFCFKIIKIANRRIAWM